MRPIRRALTGLTLLLIPWMPGTVPSAFAQQASQATAGDQRIYEVTTKDGVRYYGYLQVDTPDRVVIRTPGGAIIELVRADVMSMVEARGSLVGREFFRDDPNPTRLFFGPTGRSLKAGEAYFGIYEIVMPFVQFGLTDRLSIGGGTPLVFGGGGNHPFWVTPKFQVYEGSRTSVSAGVMHFLNVDDVNIGIAYVVSTFGTNNGAVTMGAGWAYANDNERDEGSVVGMFGAEKRLSRRVKFVTENYAFTGGGIASAGFRFLGESLSADIGILSPVGVGEFFAFPIVNFLWKF